jgi:2-methylcitrate dehydratase PrpD
MNKTSESNALEQIIANILETRFENFDSATIDHAKNRIIDTLGCLIGGARDTGNQDMVNLFKEIGGKPEATILSYGGKVPVHNAAMVNSLLARSFDFEPVSPLVDDISLPGHISGSTVMTSLSMGEAENIGGRELITALLLGDDLATRILISSGFEFNRGWDNIGTVNGFGTTAIAGRIFRLDRHQLRNAFGIVLNQIAGSMQMVWDATTSFKICQGLSSHNGIFCCRLAKSGWTGAKDALFGEFGYYNLYVDGCRNPAALTGNLGKKYYSDGTIKPYPCCRITHGPIDCALAVISKNNIEAKDIKEIIIYVSSGVLNHIAGQPFTIGEFPHANAVFNIQYTVATAFLRKGVKPEHFTEKSIRDPLISTFIKKIKLAEYTGADLDHARIKVIMNDFREFNESVDIPLGDPRKPLSKDQLLSKFWNNVDFSGSITRENAQKVLEIVENLEKLDSVNRLIALLVV